MQAPQAGFSWIPLIAIAGSLLSGGMMGAIITLIVSKYRARRQPIGYSIETIEVFKKNPEFPTLRAFVDIGDDPHTGMKNANAILENFSIIRVKVINKGNQDIADFKMGITLDEDTEAFNIKVETLDRHHIGEILTPVTIADSTNEFDISLRPFNRGDLYLISVSALYKESVGEVSLSSPHTTRFVEIGTFKPDLVVPYRWWVAALAGILVTVLWIPAERLSGPLKLFLGASMLTMMIIGTMVLKIIVGRVSDE
jgi:hypothetical protein